MPESILKKIMGSFSVSYSAPEDEMPYHQIPRYLASIDQNDEVLIQLSNNNPDDKQAEEKLLKQLIPNFPAHAPPQLVRYAYTLLLLNSRVDECATQGLEYLRVAAEANHYIMQCMLAICYDRGIGFTRDEQKAIAWFTRSANLNYVEALYHLAYFYHHGMGVTRDEKKAAVLYTNAANQGDHRAQASLALCYKEGKGVSKDEKKALELYTSAALKGNHQAQTHLALCYELGKDVKPDIGKAAKYYRLAAEQIGEYKKLKEIFSAANHHPEVVHHTMMAVKMNNEVVTGSEKRDPDHKAVRERYIMQVNRKFANTVKKQPEQMARLILEENLEDPRVYELLKFSSKLFYCLQDTAVNEKLFHPEILPSLIRDLITIVCQYNCAFVLSSDEMRQAHTLLTHPLALKINWATLFPAQSNASSNSLPDDNEAVIEPDVPLRISLFA